ncbi:MAG: hypothetical protein ABGX04_06710 [Myxococcales bacterium]|nr:hypothetical protein [Myxococcales bacterium]HIL81498.1 hypothetical protein [Myxococcales bacterium]
MALRAIAGLIGALFLVQTAGWILDPATAAEGLGMPLLDGLARSTQIGDFTSFFLALGSMAMLGAIRSNGTWLRASAILLGGAAIMRTLAWAIHDAELATELIVIEAALAIVLLAIASRFDAAATDPATAEVN